MQILETTLLGLFFGTFGTTIGGIIGCSFEKVSNKFLSFVLSFAAGLMMSIVSFELIPEALGISSINNIIIGILIGIITMNFCDIFVENKFSKKINSNSLLKIGIIVSLGLAIHNIPEGLAIGSGFDVSTKFGIGLAIAICLHDIPEGISMAVPMKSGGIEFKKVILLVILSGITTGIGAFLGAIIGNISEKIIATSLSFAAGAMIYIVLGELIPESNKLYNGKINAVREHDWLYNWNICNKFIDKNIFLQKLNVRLIFLKYLSIML